LLRNSFYVRYCWIANLAPVATAIAGLRLGFSAQSLHALQGHQTPPHLPTPGFLDRPVPESVIERIRKKLAKSPAFSLDPAHGLFHSWIIESALGDSSERFIYLTEKR